MDHVTYEGYYEKRDENSDFIDSPFIINCEDQYDFSKYSSFFRDGFNF